MKTSLDPRHKKRQKIVKLLFAESFLKQSKSSNEAQAKNEKQATWLAPYTK